MKNIKLKNILSEAESKDVAYGLSSSEKSKLIKLIKSVAKKRSDLLKDLEELVKYSNEIDDDITKKAKTQRTINQAGEIASYYGDVLKKVGKYWDTNVGDFEKNPSKSVEINDPKGVYNIIPRK